MSLLNFVLNDNTSEVYGSEINYNLRDVSIGAAVHTQAIAEFSPQAHTHNGIGFKAFILDYENRGLAVATTGKKNENGSSESDVPKEGEAGDVEKVTNGEDKPKDSPKAKALSQVNFLNNVKAKVWIPTLDHDVGVPAVYTTLPPVVSTGITDLHLYQSCTINNERILQALPPPGSLIIVDYANRQMRTGLTLKTVICRDATFARIIMSEFAGIVDTGTISEYFKSVTGETFDFPVGDPLLPSPPREPALTPDKIQESAQSYDGDTTLPNKSQHAPYLEAAHHEFKPYMKAFMFKAWSDSQLTITINSVYRTPAEQQDLIDAWKANPRSATNPGGKIKPATESYHLLGMAMDFNPTLSTGVMLTPTSHGDQRWFDAGVVAAADATNLEWGGRWSSWYDPIHIDFRRPLATMAGKGVASLMSWNISQGDQAVAPNRIDLSAASATV